MIVKGSASALAFRVPPYLRPAIYAHASECFPEECCGLIQRGDDGVLSYRRVENIAADRENAFTLDPSAYEEALEAGNLVAVFHSHTKGQTCPSREDMIGQRQTGLPWVVLVMDGEDRFIDEFSFPLPADAPVQGLEFRPGVADCVETIVRYFRSEFGIEITSEPRDDLWWLGDEENPDATAPDLFMDCFEREGFRRLAPEEVRSNPDDPGSALLLKKGDVGLVRVMSPHRLNHGVVYTGGQMMLHHLLNRVSAEAPISRWLPRIEVWLRHKSLDEEAPREDDPPLRRPEDETGAEAPA